MNRDEIPSDHPVRRLHRKSVFPASNGEDRGRDYCVACSDSGERRYMVWPCPTIQLLDGEPGCADPSHNRLEAASKPSGGLKIEYCWTCGVTNAQAVNEEATA